MSDEPKKFRKEIQPTNDKGEPIGSPHVYEADSEEELLEKMSAAIANGTRKINELSRKVALGTQEKPSVPEGLDPAVQIPVPVKRQLTADESFELTQQYKDPATVGKAFTKQFESEVGMSPEKIADELQQTRKDNAELRQYFEARSFMDAHPEYVPSVENGQMLNSWLKARNLAVTVKNLEKAFESLSAEGLLAVRTEAKPEPEPRTEEPETRTRSATPPAALRRSDGNGTTAIRPKKPSAAQIAMMTGEQILEAINAGTLTDADLARSR